MFGLGQQVRGRVVRAGRIIGHDHHFAGTGNRVDIDLPEHELLGQRHEQVPRADDLVDRPEPLDSVGEGSNGLGAA